jgi:hypothetical protein
LGEGVGAEGFPAGFAGDVGFFEEAGAVVLDDAGEEVGLVGAEVSVPVVGDFRAFAVERVGDEGRTSRLEVSRLWNHS